MIKIILLITKYLPAVILLIKQVKQLVIELGLQNRFEASGEKLKTPNRPMGKFSERYYGMYKTKNRGKFVGGEPTHIIVHYTVLDIVDTIDTLKKKNLGAVVIDKLGKIYLPNSRDYLNEPFVVYHAGKSSWGELEGMSKYSIGIEVVCDGYEPFTEKQMRKLDETIEHFQHRYNIPTSKVLGHCEISPDRKRDPADCMYDYKNKTRMNMRQYRKYLNEGGDL